MKIKNVLITSVVFLCFYLIGVASNTYADEKDQNSADFDAVTCWEVSNLSEEDKTFALVLLYGYNAGKSNDSIHSTEKMAKIIEGAGEVCAENPDMVAIQAFEKVVM